MKYIVILLIPIAFFSCRYFKENSSNKIEKKVNMAVVRSDNSYSTQIAANEDIETIPELVSKNIKKLLNNENENENENENVHDLNAIFKIQFNETINLYVIKITYKTNAIRYFLIAYDKNNKLITSSPPYINGKWIENEEKGFSENLRLIDMPLLFFKDIDNDGQKEIVMKERVHNGNIYNAVINKYFKINQKNLALDLLIAIEAKYSYFYDSKCKLLRTFKDGILSVEKYCDNGQLEKVGEVFFIRNNGKYLKEREIIYSPEFEGLLVTGSGTDIEEFINKGYISVY